MKEIFELKPNEIREVISTLPLFYNLPPEIIDSVSSKLEVASFYIDQTIIKKGDIGDCFYIIKSGHVKVVNTTENNEEYILALLDPGQGFGEIALLSNEPRTATVKAMDDVVLLRLKRSDFLELVFLSPQLKLQIKRLISQRVSFLDSKMAPEVLQHLAKPVEQQLRISLPLLELIFHLNLPEKMPHQAAHCREVAILVEEMGKILCPIFIDKLICGAYLHEIGKICINQTLARKREKGLKLTKDEVKEYLKIYEIAINIIKPFSNLYDELYFINDLSKDNYTVMSVEAQILKVADDYQEMVNKNYQNLSPDKAFKIIKQNHIKYHPKAVIALETVLERFTSITVERQINFLKAMNIALDIKDHYTLQHSHHVKVITEKIARELNISKEKIELLKTSSDIHDVGKIYISEEILNAPRRLTPEEFNIMKMHSDYSSKFVSEIPGMSELASTVRHHHEKWDGSGYPDSLKGEEIPFLSRIMAVADVFSALTTPRIYRKDTQDEKKAYTWEEALNIMDKMSGHFDLEILGEFKKIVNQNKTDFSETVKGNN